MPVKPKGKSHLICRECKHILTTYEAAVLKVKFGNKKVCPKCKSDNISYIVY